MNTGMPTGDEPMSDAFLRWRQFVDRYAESVKHVRERTGWGLGDCKVEAVKLVRILTNWGLRDSKDYVDSLESKKKRRRKRHRRRAKTRPVVPGSG